MSVIERRCSVEGCEKPWYERQWCVMHLRRVQRHGSPHVKKRTGNVPKPAEERFWSKVARGQADECWEWLAGKTTWGYGAFPLVTGDRRTTLAHRAAFFFVRGYFPDPPLELDHLCRNRGCVNPNHLEPVTRRENGLRGESIAAKYARRERCECGEEWHYRRYCPPCGLRRGKDWRARKKVEAKYVDH